MSSPSTHSADPTSRDLANVVSSPRLRVLGAWVFVFVTLLILYAPALRGQVLWDDIANITGPQLRSWSGLPRIWFQWGATQTYYPVLHTLYWIEQKLWGDATLGYHLASILFHSISVCLVYWIVRRLKIPGAALAAAIFAVHPVYVESIAWITEQKNTLSGMFTLASILVYLRFDDSRRRATYAGALGLFLLALESKATAVTLPVALLVILWWKRGALSWRRDLAPLLPWFALSLLVGLFTIWYERVYVGVQGSEFVLTPVQRCLLASRAVWFYLGKLFWPTNLILFYPRWEVNAAQAWQYLYVAGLIALLAAAWAVRRRFRAPLAALLFFLGTLFPLLGFFATYIFRYTYVCDHFQYLPSLGIVVLVSAAIALVLDCVPTAARIFGKGLCLLLLCLLAVLARNQSQIYTDDVTLFQATIAKNPACWVAHNNLGVALLDTDRQEAAKQFELALEVNPNYAQSHNNLGVVLAGWGRLPEAFEQYQQAIELDPTYAEAHANLAIALTSAGRMQEAIEQYQLAVQIKPYTVTAQNNLGNALARAGRLEEALPHLEAAVQLKPESASIHNNLGVTLADLGRFAEAIEQYQQAIELDSNNAAAYFNLAKASAKLNRTADAIGAAERALNLAQTTGQSTWIKQIETWLTNYRAALSNPAKESNRPEDVSPTP